MFNPSGRAILGKTVNNNLELNQRTDYSFFLGKGKMELMAGVSFQQTNTTGNTTNAIGFAVMTCSIISPMPVLPYHRKGKASINMHRYLDGSLMDGIINILSTSMEEGMALPNSREESSMEISDRWVFPGSFLKKVGCRKYYLHGSIS